MKRAKIDINGIVQGVGFRPFINKLVEQYGFKGWVNNTSCGVTIEVEGNENDILRFIDDIKSKSPKLAFIEKLEIKFFKNLKFYNEFQIVKSLEFDKKFTFISPDVSICDDCLRELFDSKDKRFKYPFINCTNCGPRFTIIKDVPYDRDKTTMKEFNMCQDCYDEYCDINDRRYHAQPNCCAECGPKVFFRDISGNEEFESTIEKAVKQLKEGKIIAVKGLGGYHVACDALDDTAVALLRQRKGREEKPFAVMMKNIDIVREYCFVNNDEEEILTSFRRPIVLLKKKNKVLDHISDNDSLGVMLPYTPLHYLIMEHFDVLVMTSGNIHDVPIQYKDDEAFDKLRSIVDGYLMHNRDIHVRCDDSIVKVFDGQEYFIRRSRGYVPFPIIYNSKEQILACGAEQKGAFALSKDGYIFASQHIGELRNLETLEHYSQQIEHFKRLFNINPTKIVCDMHPDYLSTNYAIEKSKDNNVPLYKVQHHHAHMASCMADNNLVGETLGIIWDGTGYGIDGSIWGGEFLLGDYKGFTRVASIKKILLPGGDKAIKDIYRIKYFLLIESLGHLHEDYAKMEDKDIISYMIKTQINSPQASSIGRLFDGVASILGLKDRVSYEGQAAILLESIAKACDDYYRFELIKDDIIYFDWTKMIKEIVDDLSDGKDRGLIAAKFMNTLSKVALEVSVNIREKFGINQVVLSGGVFQNIYLLNKVYCDLKRSNFNVYHHRKVSTNDEGLPLGQFAIVTNGGGELCV